MKQLLNPTKPQGEHMKLIATQISGLLILTLMSSTALSKELTAEDGLAKINKNIQTSQSNINDLQSNLTIVNGNIATINQTQAQLEAQKKTLQNLHKENDRILESQKKEISKYDQLIQKEKNALEDEKQKIQKLEQIIAQLKSQQEVRNKNIVDLNKNKDQFIQAKDKGQENQKQITLAIQEVDKNIQATKKEGQTWVQKRKSNEKDLAKWTKELDNHQKMQDDIKTLMEN